MDNTYTPLAGEKALRFIRLLAGTISDQLAVQLVHDTLEYLPMQLYEALSYTWGDEKPTETALLNGRPFEIRQNGCRFLRRLRDPDRSRLLWMDCLCINQADLDERAQQVKNMHLIYRHAKSVLMWLGTGDDSTTTAMQYIQQLDWERSFEEMAYYYTSHSQHAIFQLKSYLFDSMNDADQSRPPIQAIVALLSRPCLRRMWIQQEAVMGNHNVVICGKDEVPWERFMSLVWLLTPRNSNGWPAWTGGDFHTIEPSLSVAKMIHQNRLSHQRVQSAWMTEWEENRPSYMSKGRPAWLLEGHPLTYRGRLLGTTKVPDYWSEYLHNYGAYEMEIRTLEETMPDRGSQSLTFEKLVIGVCPMCGAGDSRDKVYALYNLQRPESMKTIGRPQIDYSICWQMVHIRTAKWMYKNSPDQTLGLAGRCLQKEACIPSWVPDFRKNHKFHFLLREGTWSTTGSDPYLRFLSLPRSFPGGNGIPGYSYQDKKDRRKRLQNEGLEVSAILQDKIVYMSPDIGLQEKYELSDMVDKMLHKVDVDLKQVDAQMPKYLTGDSGRDAFATTIIASTNHADELAAEDYGPERFAQWHEWLKHKAIGTIPDYHDAPENAEYFSRNNFCTTSHGLMCLVPVMARAGDYVAVLDGFRWPVVLRKVGPPQGNYYELIGECYVHEMMSGRAWDLITEFKCKYRESSEDEVYDWDSEEQLEEMYPYPPCNAKDGYRGVLRVLGKRRIVLV